MKRILIAALLFAAPLAAQVAVPAKYLSGVTIATNLPKAVNAKNQFWGITNGASATDCTSGGGSTAVICESNGTSWTAVQSGGVPSGAAGGDLSGTYPNPTVAQVNGAAVPTSAGLLGSNSSKQLIAVTAIPSTTTATTQTALTNNTTISTTQYTDAAVAAAVAGVNPAVAVLAASTANVPGTYLQVGGGIGDTYTVTATGTFTLDGIAINTIGQRVLFKDLSNASFNGVYTATVVGAIAVSPVFTRALDYDTPSDVNNTGAIPVQSGTVNTTTSWLLTSQVTSIGSAGSALTYASFSLNPATSIGFKFVTSQTVTGSPAATITFSSIPGTAQNLMLQCDGQTSGVDNIGVNFNGDATAAHYVSTRVFASSTAMTAALITGVAYGFTSFGDSTTLWSISGIIHGYTQTTFATKNIETTDNRFQAGNNTPGPERGVSQWTPTVAAAITNIVLTEEAGTFKVGTVCTLYGMP